jgi:V/A-type H+-transporting ATPase subunit I
MFYPEEMKRVAIGFHSTFTDDAISELHEEGVVQMIPFRDDANTVRDILEPILRPRILDRISEYSISIDRILEVFRQIPKDQANPVAAFLSPPEIIPVAVRREKPEELFADIDTFLGKTGRIIEIRNDLNRIGEDLQAMQTAIGAIEALIPFGFDLSALGDSEYLSVCAGRIDAAKYPEFVRDIRAGGDGELVVYEHGSGSFVLVVLVLPRARKPLIERYLRPPRFQPLDPSSSGLPAEALARKKNEEALLTRERENLLTELKSLEATWGPSARALREELLMLKEEREGLTACGKSRSLIVVEGWVPAGKVAGVEKRLLDTSDGHAFVNTRNPGEEDPEPPTKYQNPAWLKPFEVLTTTFARPHYDEIDPTPFIAPIFVLFFGLMLGDAGYGLILTIAGLFLYSRLGRSSRSMHDMTYILVIIGISATILGIIQGGWFGDIPQRFFGATPPFIMIEPLKDPITFFQFSLILGIIHINLGLCLALYQNLKKGLKRPALFEQGVWFILQPSAGILLAGFFGWVDFSPFVVYAAYAGAIVGVLMIFYYRGPMGFFGLTGFLGDWLSYVRILALALATGGIAMTVNILAELIAGIHPIMIIPAAAIFLGGHVFNIIIQSLGGVIHAIRLQYIEFFGKFYTGGGKPFRPFRAERVYSRVEPGDPL